MHLFEQSVFDGCEHTMRGWPKKAAADAYAIAMMLSFTDNDIRKPDIALACNTEAGVNRIVEARADPEDAHWNEIVWYKGDGQAICVGEAIRAGGYEIFRRRLEFLRSAIDTYNLSDDEYYDSLTALLLNAVVNIGRAFHEDKRRIYRLLQIVFHKTSACPRISSPLLLLATALHTLFPAKFLPPECDPDTNNLINHNAFGC